MVDRAGSSLFGHTASEFEEVDEWNDGADGATQHGVVLYEHRARVCGHTRELEVRASQSTRVRQHAMNEASGKSRVCARGDSGPIRAACARAAAYTGAAR